MLEYLKTRAVILNLSSWKESDVIVQSYTNSYGRLVAVAGGLKKPGSKLAASILPGNVVYLTLVKKVQWHLTGAKIIDYLSLNLAEPIIFRLASAAREAVINIVPEGQKDKILFNNFVICLKILTSKSFPLEFKEVTAYRFLFSLFKQQGILPNWQVCQHDGGKILLAEDIYWHEQKGVICSVCREHYRNDNLINISLILKKVFLTKTPVENLTILRSVDKGYWQKIIDNIYTKELDRPLVSFNKKNFKLAGVDPVK